MRDKILMTVLTVLFFLGAMVSLKYNNNGLFIFSSTLCNVAFGGVVALVRGEKPESIAKEMQP